MSGDRPLHLAEWMKSILLYVGRSLSIGEGSELNHLLQLISCWFTTLCQKNLYVLSYCDSPLISTTTLLSARTPTTHLKTTSTLSNSLFLFYLSHTHTHTHTHILEVFFSIIKEELGFWGTMVLASPLILDTPAPSTNGQIVGLELLLAKKWTHVATKYLVDLVKKKIKSHNFFLGNSIRIWLESRLWEIILLE